MCKTCRLCFINFRKGFDLTIIFDFYTNTKIKMLVSEVFTCTGIRQVDSLRFLLFYFYYEPNKKNLKETKMVLLGDHHTNVIYYDDDDVLMAEFEDGLQ